MKCESAIIACVRLIIYVRYYTLYAANVLCPKQKQVEEVGDPSDQE